MIAILMFCAVSSLECSIFLMGVTLFLDYRAAARRRKLRRRLAEFLRAGDVQPIEIAERPQAA
jgi:hypothetical protein